MIRFIYWSLALLEVLLVLAVLLLFIITDSRAIKYIAQTSLEAYHLSYESIEGNLFDGLEIKNLAYENKELFSSALIHWNPLTLFDNKITITKLDAQGIELENIMAMLNTIKFNKSEKQSALAFNFLVEKMHFDMNPYIYEGLKFSSFVFETDKIAIDRTTSVNINKVYLKFDSDIVNVKMNAKIKNNQLLVENLDLKNISAKDITKLSHRLKSKYKNKKGKKTSASIQFKEIKIKHILGTMKAAQYGDFKIKGGTLNFYEAVIESSKKFTYQVQKVDFKGQTNFGKLAYKGSIKDANIYAKGHITLDKKLFNKYSLPLNFKNLEKLPSSLHLNHEAVWIDIDHKVNKLLKIKSDFNVDISKAKHKLHYDYFDRVFIVKSDVNGKMTYAKAFKVKNMLRIDNKGFSYGGEVKVSKLTALPSVVSEYLLTNLVGKYKANTDSFEMDLESDLLTGHFTMPKYRSGKLLLKSKKANIALNKFIADLPLAFQNEKISLESKNLFNFKSFKKSELNLKVEAKSLVIEGEMKLEKPFEIHFLSKIKNETILKKIMPNLNFNHLRELEGSVKFKNALYQINIGNQELKFWMNYNAKEKVIKNGRLNLGKHQFSFTHNKDKSLIIETGLVKTEEILDEIKRFYTIKVPNIQGKVNLRFEKKENGIILLNFRSPHLKYLSTEGVDLSVMHIYNIETKLKIDKDSNIELKSYQFKLDDNGYFNVFYSSQSSYLKLKNNNLILKKFWLNDKIELTGNYNIETLRGELKVDSNRYALRNKDFSLILNLDLNIKLDKKKIDVRGGVNILGDNITYEVVGSNIVEDADIVVVEDMIREKESVFNNVKLYIKVKSKKPLTYIADKVNINFLNELSILKNYNQKMLVTGVTKITDGYYQLEDKRFLLDESHLYFTGDIKSPLLDIKANYEKDEYNIHIFISGTTDAPIVNFNAEPYLTQQEILSLILFDGTGSSSGKGAEAYTILGGSFAKGLVKSLGIDIDHLLLGKDREEQLSLEVGKKISKDISVLYLHRDGLDGVKVRVEHSKSFETDIIIQPPNTSSIEFLYKQDR